MGAGLPWLASWLAAEGKLSLRLSWIYACNTLGGAAGAVITGLFLLPAVGYQKTLIAAGSADIVIGLAALWLSRANSVGVRESPAPLSLRQLTAPLLQKPIILWIVVFLSGWTAMLYEITWNRVAGLVFGPTATSVALTLAVVLLGFAAGAAFALAIARSELVWLSWSQSTVALLALTSSLVIAVSPVWLGEQIRSRSNDFVQLESFEAVLLFLLLFPLTMAAGMTLPLAMQLLRANAAMAGEVGRLYGLNTAGCIAGALMAGWLLVPHWGSERTIYAGALVNAGLAILLLPANNRGPARRTGGLVTAALAGAAFVFPQWDLSALTAGAYKYALYYRGSAASELHRGDLAFLHEGAAGTVTVRKIDGSLIMAIDGKVDATDTGGDLLTEKLLAHLPLHLLNHPRTVCVIGLASGVTAGAALTYPIERLDVVEVSPEIVQASHLFDGVNGKPLEEPRTQLIVNDGRNHLTLTGRRYDAILSEPSNPWISGMNSLFTREFFRIARRRLNPGGVLAQWFHLYNMPADDLGSLLRAFVDVFPSAVLWQLNDGDVLLTGQSNPQTEDASPGKLPGQAAADLLKVGVGEPALLSTLYVMRGSDLARFAGSTEENTDDLPILEFHGQRDLNAQTDTRNADELAGAPKQMDTPRAVRAAWEQMTPERWVERGGMFEKAESYRMAFQSYRQAAGLRASSIDALAGMMRTARTPEERSAAGTLESRTRDALADAQAGKVEAADTILQAVKQAFGGEPEAHFNYGLFCLERARYDEAIRDFAAAIAANHGYLPAYEGMAEAYLRKHDLTRAAEWSRRILQIDPSHAIARKTLARIEKSQSARDAVR
jgi:spermidine synthase